MRRNIREFMGLSSGSQESQSELYVLEKILEYYTTDHDSTKLTNNPKMIVDPENPSEVYVSGGGEGMAAINLTFDHDTGPYDDPNRDMPNCHFTYTFPLLFC